MSVVYFKKLSETAVMPTKGYSGDAGWDLYTDREVTIPPGWVMNIPTGIAIAIPDGYWGHLVARSSTPLRYGIDVGTAVIDGGYRGELFIRALNYGHKPVTIGIHSRIAQIIFLPIPNFTWCEVEELPPSERGNKGFGSTGR